MTAIFLPILLLMLASLGVGGVLMAPMRSFTPPLPSWLDGTLKYFLGQGVLASVLLGVALAGLFSPIVILGILLTCAVVGAVVLGRMAQVWARSRGGSRRLWTERSVGWKLLTAAMLVGVGFGFTTLGGMVEGDPIAFYLVVSKLLVHTHQLALVPGYESFSSIGLFAEVLIAALMSLGMPDLSPRIFSWFNFLPMLVLVYGLAAQCGLGPRGRLLSLIVLITSSAAMALWGTGKTDLFAVGPAIAAYAIALASWHTRPRWLLVVLAGVLCGFATVFKLSYVLPLVPAIALIIVWPALFRLFNEARASPVVAISAFTRSSLVDGVAFSLAFFVAIAPHLLKNILLLDSALGPSMLTGHWYAPTTVRWLLLTYPFALTYGSYWAQIGNLSPLVLAFFPLLIYRRGPQKWAGSRLASLTVASLLGVACWMALMPSIFMPRYFLATLLMLGIPAAAGAEAFSFVGRLPNVLVIFAALIALLVAPRQTMRHTLTFDAANTMRYLKNPYDQSILTGPMAPYARAHNVLNHLVGANERILMITYYRYWLRPDLIQSASTEIELAQFLNASGDATWKKVETAGFKFLLTDTSLAPSSKRVLDQIPSGVSLKEVFREGSLAAYEIVYAGSTSIHQ